LVKEDEILHLETDEGSCLQVGHDVHLHHRNLASKVIHNAELVEKLVEETAPSRASALPTGRPKDMERRLQKRDSVQKSIFMTVKSTFAQREDAFDASDSTGFY
jgi:hypothetical protein